MATLEEVNRLVECGVSEFRIQCYDGWRLVIIGSYDLCYYHDVELIFTNVAHISCLAEFSWPTFREAGESSCGGRRRFSIRGDDGDWEIVAEAVEVVIGKVYHYDRREHLQPGERIADWLPRSTDG